MPVCFGIILNLLLKSVKASGNCQNEYQKPDHKTEPKVNISQYFLKLFQFRTYNLNPQKEILDAER